MKTSTKRILSIGFAGLFFIGILVVYSSLIQPEMSQISDKRATVISKENLFNNEKNAVTQVQNLIGQFQSIAKLQETVSLALPLAEGVTQALNQVQSIADLSQVNINSFAVKPFPFQISRQPLVKRLGSLELNLSLNGSYDGLKQFLRSLETNVRVMNVTDIKLSQASQALASQGGVGNFSMTLTVATYYQEK